MNKKINFVKKKNKKLQNLSFHMVRHILYPDLLKMCQDLLLWAYYTTWLLCV